MQHTSRFVCDTSRLWYKPHISRDEGNTCSLHFNYLSIGLLNDDVTCSHRHVEVARSRIVRRPRLQLVSGRVRPRGQGQPGSSERADERLDGVTSARDADDDKCCCVAGESDSELVRHFLIERSSKGVKLKGCSNEPVFSECPPLFLPRSWSSTHFYLPSLRHSGCARLPTLDHAARPPLQAAPAGSVGVVGRTGGGRG